MATQYANGKIVSDGLVLALDAADRNSYVSGSLIWNDMSGIASGGSLVNGPTFSSGNGGSIVFDGVDDFVDIASSSTYKVPYPLSITVWFRLSSLPSVMYTLLETDNEANSFHAGVAIGITTTGFAITCGNNTQNDAPGRRTYSAPYSLANNQWYAVAFVFTDNLTMSTYVNNTQITTSYSSGTATTLVYSSSPMSIGYSIDVTPRWHINGNIASTQIYNRALSAKEVLQNYNAQKSRFGLK